MSKSVELELGSIKHAKMARFMQLLHLTSKLNKRPVNQLEGLQLRDIVGLVIVCSICIAALYYVKRHGFL
jgi:hypothetical protein